MPSASRSMPQGRIYSGHNGGDTRGFHYVQGASYRKGFEKHGVLANPYSFGFFEAMKANKSQRFSHTWVLNEADGLPAQYRGKLFAVEPLQGRVMLSEVKPDRSSFQTKDLGGVVTSSDTWFRPVDIKPAPDGSLFVADFYEAKIAHLGPQRRRHRSRHRPHLSAGREGCQVHEANRSGKKTSTGLIELLRSDNRWQRETALRLLGDRKDKSILARTDETALCQQRAARARIAVGDQLDRRFRCGPCREMLAASGAAGAPVDRAVACRRPSAWRQDRGRGWRRWPEPNRACTPAASMPPVPNGLSAAEGLPIVQGLLMRDEDAGDIHVPLLLWWAIEVHCGKDRDKVLDVFRESSLWRAKIVEETILPRLIKRFAMAGTQKDYQACVELFRLAPEKKHGQNLLKGFEEAFKGRSIAGLPDELLAEIAKLGGGSIAFGVRQGKDDGDRPRRWR